MNSNTYHVGINLILFQCAWFSLILNWQQGLIGFTCVMLLLIHALWCENRPFFTLGFILMVTLCGIMADSLMVYFKLYKLESEFMIYGFPHWLVLLWCGFSLTLNQSLLWLMLKPKLFIVSLTVMGPISYLAGQKLGAIEVANGSFGWMMLQWGFLSLAILAIYSVIIKKQPENDVIT